MKTYKQQFDKLTEAYIKGEVNPFRVCACFVGNLLDGEDGWADYRDLWMNNEPTCSVPNRKRVELDYYTPRQIVHLEHEFMKVYCKNHPLSNGRWKMDYEDYKKLSDVLDENALFLAFEKTLGVLKDIHEKRGEVIDETPVFEKRELQPM